jgi:hypothetical protein
MKKRIMFTYLFLTSLLFANNSFTIKYSPESFVIFYVSQNGSLDYELSISGNVIYDYQGRISQFGSAKFIYDFEGKLSSAGGAKITYDFQGRVSDVSGKIGDGLSLRM